MRQADAGQRRTAFAIETKIRDACRATDKIVGFSEHAAAFLDAHFA
jgi:hypothetical protein